MNDGLPLVSALGEARAEAENLGPFDLALGSARAGRWWSPLSEQHLHLRGGQRRSPCQWRRCRRARPTGRWGLPLDGGHVVAGRTSESTAAGDSSLELGLGQPFGSLGGSHPAELSVARWRVEARYRPESSWVTLIRP